MYRARVLEQDAEPRGEREPLAAAAPPRSQCLCSGLAEADPYALNWVKNPEWAPTAEKRRLNSLYEVRGALGDHDRRRVGVATVNKISPLQIKYL